MIIGQVGDFAYVDAFAGLVPCKVLEINGRSLTVRYTATRGAYKRGTVTTHSAHWVVPRKAVYVRSYQYKISPYKWEGTPKGCHNPDHQVGNL